MLVFLIQMFESRNRIFRDESVAQLIEILCYPGARVETLDALLIHLKM